MKPRSTLIMAALALPLLTAAGPREPGAPPESGASGPAAEAAPSFWEDPLWRQASPTMKMFICKRPKPLASWCAVYNAAPAERPRSAPTIETEPQRSKAVPDKIWFDFLAQADPERLTPRQLELVRQRAGEDKDPSAMEILAYSHAKGIGTAVDYAAAYRWYALAYLAGAAHVQNNMDALWAALRESEKKTLVQQFESALPEAQ